MKSSSSRAAGLARNETTIRSVTYDDLDVGILVLGILPLQLPWRIWYMPSACSTA